MSNGKDSLGDRMKRYESVPKNYLTRRVPVIIRVDGKAFHTFTRGMKKPFDSVLMNTMKDTMKYLCENIQGCVFGYTQSDEITLVLTDYATITTDAWFGYSVQKMVSIAASIATLAFNKFLYRNIDNYFNEDDALDAMFGSDSDRKNEISRYAEVLREALRKGAMFDARAFSIPKDEVCNCLIWRQQDATRNSIQSVGQAYFSHKALNGKTCNNIQEMLWQEYKVNWSDYPIECKRGSCCIKQMVDVPVLNQESGEVICVSRNRWVIDTEPPVFTQEREYIERFL